MLYPIQPRRKDGDFRAWAPSVPTDLLLCDVFLHNRTSRAGRYVRIDLRAGVDPHLNYCRFRHGDFREPSGLAGVTACVLVSDHTSTKGGQCER
jgi:hypothetical protein